MGNNHWKANSRSMMMMFSGHIYNQSDDSDEPEEPQALKIKRLNFGTCKGHAQDWKDAAIPDYVYNWQGHRTCEKFSLDKCVELCADLECTHFSYSGNCCAPYKGNPDECDYAPWKLWTHYKVLPENCDSVKCRGPECEEEGTYPKETKASPGECCPTWECIVCQDLDSPAICQEALKSGSCVSPTLSHIFAERCRETCGICFVEHYPG